MELGPQRGGWWKRTGSDVAHVPPLLLTDRNVITAESSTFSILKTDLESFLPGMVAMNLDHSTKQDVK